MNAREVVDRMVKRAEEIFSRHELILNEKERWRIARKYEDGSIDGNLATEIISLWNGRLFVGGDIDDVVFAYFGDKRDEESYHLRKLNWIGRQHSIDYVEEKASVGMTDGGKLTSVWDDDVAVYELQEMLNDELSEEDREAIQDAIESVDDGEFWVWEKLYRAISDPYDIPSNLGKVTAPRVIYAWAACRRLCELLS